MADSGERLALRLQYSFNDPGLLQLAVSHRSVGSINNERLEYLGDAILDFVIAEVLYQRFPQASEGNLSRMRAHLVKGETLAVLAREISLGDYLRLGPGELKSGGFRRDSILAGALEAVFGAVYLDGGFPAARDLILRLYEELLDTASLENISKDPKTRLQEYLQARGQALPSYQVNAVEGKDHKQVFHVSCETGNLPQPVEGRGRNRRRAEQDAAARTLELLEKNDS